MDRKVPDCCQKGLEEISDFFFPRKLVCEVVTQRCGEAFYNSLLQQQSFRTCCVMSGLGYCVNAGMPLCILNQGTGGAGLS